MISAQVHSFDRCDRIGRCLVGTWSRVRVTTASLLAALAACAPASVRGPYEGRVLDNGFCLNGMLALPGGSDLREVLERRLPPRTLHGLAPGSPGPLVLIDGIAVDGIERLGGLRAADVAGVETLEPFRATPEYGARAREGAIVVVTKRGLRAGVTARPDARPLTPCSNAAR